MTEVSPSVVLKVAKLARLNLKDEEVDYYSEQLSKVIGYIEQINEAEDKFQSDWRSEFLREETLLAEDSSRKFSALEKVLAQAPASSQTSFLVPKIIE